MTDRNTDPKLILTPMARVLLLLSIAFMCFFIMSLLTGLVTSWGENITTPRVRILSMVQDVLVFVIPAIATALMVTRVPAALLLINRNMNMSTLLLSILTMIAAMPALNLIIAWNASWHLPEWMSSFDVWSRAMEASSQRSIDAILGGSGIGDLIMSLLIVGIAAGFSEELFFRGAFQRLLGSSSLGRNGAVWIAAIVFSCFHFQLFGLVPRILLGAWFGYLLIWSRCIWLPIIAHILNNSIYVINNWVSAREGLQNVSPGMEIPDSFQSWLLIAISLALTVVGVILTRRSTH